MRASAKAGARAGALVRARARVRAEVGVVAEEWVAAGRAAVSTAAACQR